MDSNFRNGGLAFAFEDSMSESLYNQLITRDPKLIEYFNRRTHQFGEECNSLPPRNELRITEVVCCDTYSLSDRSSLESALYRLVKKSKGLANHTRSRYISSIHKFMTSAIAGNSSIATYWLVEEPLRINSHLFESLTLTLDLVGGHLIRVFLSLKPSCSLSRLFYDISVNEQATSLWIRRKLFKFKETYVHRVKPGNATKLEEISAFDSGIDSEVKKIFTSQLCKGIFLKNFNGVPILQIYRYEDYSASTPGSNLLAQNTDFFKLFAQGGGSANHSLYLTPDDDELIVSSIRKNADLHFTCKLIEVSSAINASYQRILSILAEKAAMHILLFRLTELKIKLAKPTLAKAVADLGHQRLELYQLSTVFKIFSASFVVQQSSLLGSFGSNDNLTRWTGSSKASAMSFSDECKESIKYMLGQIEQQLTDLFRDFSVLRDESNDRFQARIQCLALWLTILIAPLATIGLERLADYYVPQETHPQDGP